MKITITINTGNAAFEEDPGFEVGRVLRTLADKVEVQGFEEHRLPLYDVNGNRVGEMTIEGE